MSESLKPNWQWRHLLLILGTILGAELARSGVSVYRYYQRFEETSILGEANVFLEETREVIRDARDDPHRQQLLDEYVASHEDEGLRYLLFRSKRKGTVVDAGVATIIPNTREIVEARQFEKFQKPAARKLHGDRVYFFIPELHLIDGRYKGPPEVRARGPKHKQRDPLTHLPPVQVVEFVPVRTLEMRSRALLTLIIGLFGAFVSIFGSFYTWRLIGKHARVIEEAQEQRTLAKLGQMSAVISHELRNPLAGAMGQIQLLTMMLEGMDREHAKAEQIQHDLKRLEELSETLLSFVNSRRINRGEYRCATLVRDLDRLANDDRLVIDDEQMPAIWNYDPITLVRAVDNLISNALIFTEESGKVYLTLGQENGALMIAVRDEGPGFPEGLDMFEPFVTTRDKGTGLGLAIAAEVVRSHGGTISAVNHPRGGAVVSISIPSARPSSQG